MIETMPQQFGLTPSFVDPPHANLLDPSYTWPDVPWDCCRLPNLENVEKC